MGTVSKCIEIHLTNVPQIYFEYFWGDIKVWVKVCGVQAGDEGGAVATEINLDLCGHAKEPEHV